MVYKCLDPGKDWDAWCNDHPEPPEIEDVDERYWMFKCDCEEFACDFDEASIYDVGVIVLLNDGRIVERQQINISRHGLHLDKPTTTKHEFPDGKWHLHPGVVFECPYCGASIVPCGYDFETFIEEQQ